MNNCMTVIKSANDLKKLNIGDKVFFIKEKKPYTVKAKDDRYMIITKHMFDKVFYSILDLKEKICGPDDYVFGQFDYGKQKDIDLAFKAINSNEFEISHRHRANIVDVIFEYYRKEE